MIKLRTLIILIVIYIILIISFNNRINILYPYYYLKDLLFYPVHAINEEVLLNENMENEIINNLNEEIQELKKINNISFVLTDFKKINATVIERNREYWFNTITINKGKSDNIKEDMAVIDSNGLIGRIGMVNNHTSTVKLITTNDVKNKISAVIKGDKDIYGIINGYDYQNNYLSLVINENIEIKKELIVETTGMGGVFPKGILIGKTIGIKKGNDGVTNIVMVLPSSNIEGVRYVSILQREIISN